jgi:Ran GTPase-activating protein (RanGAP) involved in mRNA processing and transport
LHLDFNGITAQGVTVLVDALIKRAENSQPILLEELSLRHNCLCKEGGYQIARLLQRIEIKNLGLTGNSIGNDGVDRICSVLCSRMGIDSKIRRLDLWDNQLSVSTFSLLHLLKEHPTLRYLGLNSNSFNTDAGALFYNSIIHNNVIVELSLFGNDIKSREIISMIDAHLRKNLELLNSTDKSTQKEPSRYLSTTPSYVSDLDLRAKQLDEREQSLIQREEKVTQREQALLDLLNRLTGDYVTGGQAKLHIRLKPQ